MNAQHSSASNEHYTPVDIIEAARSVMGGIDLDPATTASVNHAIVKAETFYTKEGDGLSNPWHGRVWLNPPGGRIRNRSSAAVWWQKLAHEYWCGTTTSLGGVTEAIFLGFSTEVLATTQRGFDWVGDFPFCIPCKRIQFLQERDGVFVPGESPTHSNIIVYLPRDANSVERFRDAFEPFGRVRI